MKQKNQITHHSFKLPLLALVLAAGATLAAHAVHASQAYGTVNNFDVVNDTSN